MIRIVNNSQCTHEFFYCNVSTVNQDYTFNTSCSFGTSFSDDEYTILNFYSYSTKVAMLYRSHKTNETYLLIHWSSMTPTTGRHLNYLRSANPYYTVLYVPFEYGEHSTGLNTIINKCLNGLETFNKNNILISQYKENFLNYYTALKNIIEFIKDLEPEQQIIFDKATELLNFINSNEYSTLKKQHTKEKAQKTRQENKEKKEKEQQLINEYKEKYSYYELVNICCNYDSPLYKGTKHEEKQFIANKILNTSINYQGQVYKYNALVWFDGDKVKTSKHITVNKNDVIKLLKLWKHNKIKHGMQIDKYTILALTDDYIKIGCHTIPIENIKALYEEYQKEQQLKEVA